MKLINVPLTPKELRGLIRDYRSWSAANMEMAMSARTEEYRDLGIKWGQAYETRANELALLLPPKRKR